MKKFKITKVISILVVVIAVLFAFAWGTLLLGDVIVTDKESQNTFTGVMGILAAISSSFVGKLVWNIMSALEIPGEFYEVGVSSLKKKLENYSIYEKANTKEDRKYFAKLNKKYKKENKKSLASVLLENRFMVILCRTPENQRKMVIRQKIDEIYFPTDVDKERLTNIVHNIFNSKLDKSYDEIEGGVFASLEQNSQITFRTNKKINIEAYRNCPNCGGSLEAEDHLACPWCHTSCYDNEVAFFKIEQEKEKKNQALENKIQQLSNKINDESQISDQTRQEVIALRDEYPFNLDIFMLNIVIQTKCFNFKDDDLGQLSNNILRYHQFCYDLKVDKDANGDWKMLYKFVNDKIKSTNDSEQLRKLLDFAMQTGLINAYSWMLHLKIKSDDFKNIETISENNISKFEELCKHDGVEKNGNDDYIRYLKAAKKATHKRRFKTFLLSTCVTVLILVVVFLTVQFIAVSVMKNANSLKDKGDFEEAIAEYESVKKIVLIKEWKSEITSAIAKCEIGRDVNKIKAAYDNKEYENIVADFEADKYAHIKGNNEAMYYVACSYFEVGGAANEKTAINTLTSLSDGGYFYAQVYLGNYYSERGNYYNGGLYDYNKIELAIKHFQEAVNQSAYAELAKDQYEFACAWLEYYYSKFENPISQKDMIAIFKNLDNKGYAFATVWLGKNAEATDLNEAKNYYKRVGAFPDAQVALGVLLYSENRFEEAKGYFNLASALNNPEALYYLGLYYELGHAGTEKDNVKALEYYQKAAELGCSKAEEKIISFKK